MKGEKMTDKRVRYSKLAPLSVQERLRLSALAIKFFSPLEYRSMCEVIEKESDRGQIRPLNGLDFLSYLSKTNVLIDPNRYLYRIRDLLSQLVAHNILTDMGIGRGFLIGRHYYFLRELTKRENEGVLWLAPALGPDFIRDTYSAVTLQLTGTNSSGDAHAGTGIAIAPRWILTCAHVVTDMTVDLNQEFDGKEYSVVRTHPHSCVDVALVEVDTDLPQLPGLAFRDPKVTETVYTLGYPRIPLSRNPALAMQRGEITNPDVVIFSGEEVFLYSAIARPGNSGGPIIASNGHVVGIVTEELSEEALRPGMPFYAGVRASEVEKAIIELEPSAVLPMETYE